MYSTIDAGSVMGATSENYKLSSYCSTLEAKGCCFLNYQNLRFSVHLHNEPLKVVMQKMHI